MIGFLEGEIARKDPGFLQVLAAGVGYDLHIPLSTSDTIGEVGDRVRIQTYLHVREDILQLYGFTTVEEKEAFLRIIQVSGVGPRIALGILSHLSVERLAGAVNGRDSDLLSTIPGVGKKTAERLILELQGKFPEAPVAGERARPQRVAEEEAIRALVALGYTPSLARRAVLAAGEGNGEASTEELVKMALARIGG